MPRHVWLQYTNEKEIKANIYTHSAETEKNEKKNRKKQQQTY